LEEIIAVPQVTQKLLKKHRISLTKGLGQNFLVDRGIVDEIVLAGEIDDDDNIIEIGPGIGSLTQALLEKLGQGKLYAIEKDERLVKLLKKILQSEKLVLINKDVLDIEWTAFFAEHGLDKKPVKLIANLPYYISTPIIMGLLEARIPIDRYVFMVQKEVAERMIAKPGRKDYGALSIAVQYYSSPEMVRVIGPDVFIPQPDVYSAIIKLERNEEPPIKQEDVDFFFRVVKAIFQQRRKNIKNALSNAGNITIDKNIVLECLEELGLDQNIRGEKLDLATIGNLSDLLYRKQILYQDGE
jgi:16S rRNA (adenine1518-N6/adenine1519-N6)-dimethyltransferase